MHAGLPATRVAVLDDHHAIRAGIEAMLAAEPDLVLVGSAAGEYELWPMLRRTQPDILLLDIDHPGHDGLWLALRLSDTALAPRVVLHTARSGDEIAVAAAVAGAGAVVEKAADRLVLLDALRGRPPVASGITAAARGRAAALLEPADHAILAMRLAGTSKAEIAATLQVAVATVDRRMVRILRRLEHAARPLPSRRPAAVPIRHAAPPLRRRLRGAGPSRDLAPQ